jgi:hypothetical protein
MPRATRPSTPPSPDAAAPRNLPRPPPARQATAHGLAASRPLAQLAGPQRRPLASALMRAAAGPAARQGGSWRSEEGNAVAGQAGQDVLKSGRGGPAAQRTARRGSPHRCAPHAGAPAPAPRPPPGAFLLRRLAGPASRPLGVRAYAAAPAAAPKTMVDVVQRAHGFVLERHQFVREYDSHVCLYRHEKTGGRGGGFGGFCGAGGGRAAPPVRAGVRLARVPLPPREDRWAGRFWGVGWGL